MDACKLLISGCRIGGLAATAVEDKVFWKELALVIIDNMETSKGGVRG